MDKHTSSKNHSAVIKEQETRVAKQEMNEKGSGRSNPKTGNFTPNTTPLATERIATDLGNDENQPEDDRFQRDPATPREHPHAGQESKLVQNANNPLNNGLTNNDLIGIIERKGGLSWVRTNNGNVLPQIENTWLKHIITSLQSNKNALISFFNNLEKCLIESVLFLYREGIKPYLGNSSVTHSGDVANQMKRSICDNFWSAAEVAYVSLHCKNKVKLNIELRVKGEMGWVVYLINEPPNFKGFVDTHSTINNYNNYYWRQLNKYVADILTVTNNTPAALTKYSYSANLTPNSSQMNNYNKDVNGGRYAFAEKLKNEVSAFKNMRLGEVVHLVQLAIYSGVFVYAQRILLPVAACEKTAQELFPKLKKSRYPICTCINEVLKIVSLLVDNRKNGLVLAQLKQQFMLQFNKELNPLSFGYRKLQNLLLSDIFNKNYHLFIPVDSPHRTHIQNKKYNIPPNCKIFKQSKLQFDINKFPNPVLDYYDTYYNICPKHNGNVYNREIIDNIFNREDPDEDALSKDDEVFSGSAYPGANGNMLATAQLKNLNEALGSNLAGGFASPLHNVNGANLYSYNYGLINANYTFNGCAGQPLVTPLGADPLLTAAMSPANRLNAPLKPKPNVECTCMWKLDFETLPKTVQSVIRDCLD